MSFYFIIIVTLISIRFWSFQLIPEIIYSILEGISFLLIIFLLIINNKSKYPTEMIFKNHIKILIILSLLSSIPAFLFHEQSIFYSIFKLRFLAFWGIYFLLHNYKIPPNKIISFIIITGFIWATITIIQQYTYPIYFFYSRSDENNSILRDDIYRFMVYRHHFGIFLILYTYSEFLKKQKTKYLLLFIIGLIGLYFFGTRQFFVVTILMLIFMTISKRGFKKFTLIALSFFVVIFLYDFLILLYFDFFSNWVERTINEINNPRFSRYLSGYFFLVDYWPHWSTIFWGNGLEYKITSYGNEIDLLKSQYNYYRSDIGLLGTTNIFGIFYSINLIFLLYKGVKKSTKDYLKYFFISLLILIPLTDYSYNQTFIPFFCILLYLIDYHIIERKGKLNNGIQTKYVVLSESENLT